jgi:hydroxyacylglutathione hydrolase
MKVEIINQLKDNYCFVLYNDTLKSCVIDPADSNPILNFALENNLTIEDIFITHHHKDHTSGVKGILNAFPEVNIHSPSAQIENTRFVLRDGDEVNSCLNTFKIIKTPGHTLDHIMYYDENNGVLFCGDTLFRLGCGRVFEGTLNEMFKSLKSINELDKNTIIYCGHEYTISNLNFLEKTLKKESVYLTVRNKINDDLNNKGKSVPFLLEDEKQYNLFLNQNSKLGTIIKKELGFTDFELFAYLRKAKDSF